MHTNRQTRPRDVGWVAPTDPVVKRESRGGQEGVKRGSRVDGPYMFPILSGGALGAVGAAGGERAAAGGGAHPCDWFQPLEYALYSPAI
eukprot:9374057-Pyramimonas_sp.AAC.1